MTRAPLLQLGDVYGSLWRPQEALRHASEALAALGTMGALDEGAEDKHAASGSSSAVSVAAPTSAELQARWFSAALQRARALLALRQHSAAADASLHIAAHAADSGSVRARARALALQAEALSLQGFAEDALATYASAQAQFAQAFDTGPAAAAALLQHAAVRVALGMREQAAELTGLACELLQERAGMLGLKEARAAPELRNVYLRDYELFARARLQRSEIAAAGRDWDVAAESAAEAAAVLQETRGGALLHAAAALQRGVALAEQPELHGAALAALGAACAAAMQGAGPAWPQARLALLHAAAVHVRAGGPAAAAAALRCLSLAAELHSAQHKLSQVPELLDGPEAAAIPDWATAAMTTASTEASQASLGLCAAPTAVEHRVLALRLCTALAGVHSQVGGASLSATRVAQAQAAQLHAVLSSACLKYAQLTPAGAPWAALFRLQQDSTSVGSPARSTLVVQLLACEASISDALHRELAAGARHSSIPATRAEGTASRHPARQADAKAVTLLYAACVREGAELPAAPAAPVAEAKQAAAAKVAQPPAEPTPDNATEWSAGSVEVDAALLHGLSARVRRRLRVQASADAVRAVLPLARLVHHKLPWLVLRCVCACLLQRIALKLAESILSIPFAGEQRRRAARVWRRAAVRCRARTLADSGTSCQRRHT